MEAASSREWRERRFLLSAGGRRVSLSPEQDSERPAVATSVVSVGGKEDRGIVRGRQGRRRTGSDVSRVLMR